MSQLSEGFIKVGFVLLGSEWVPGGGEGGGVAVASLASARTYHTGHLGLLGAPVGAPLGQVLVQPPFLAGEVGASLGSEHMSWKLFY